MEYYAKYRFAYVGQGYLPWGDKSRIIIVKMTTAYNMLCFRITH